MTTWVAGRRGFAAPRPRRFVNRPYGDVGGMPVSTTGLPSPWTPAFAGVTNWAWRNDHMGGRPAGVCRAPPKAIRESPYGDVGGMPVSTTGLPSPWTPAFAGVTNWGWRNDHTGGRPPGFTAPRPGCPQGAPLRLFWQVVGRHWAIQGRLVDPGGGQAPRYISPTPPLDSGPASGCGAHL